jgi:AmiR/NasT family two-component response regulator
VILSTLSVPGLEQRALWMGADAYIVKPLDAFQIPGLLRDSLAA